MKRSSGEVLKTLGNLTGQGAPQVFGAVVLALSLFAGGCSSENNRFGGDRYRLPWADGDGQLELRTVQLKTLENPENFEGSAARILVQPSDSQGRLVGETPRGRYIRTSDGTIVPADYTTLQAVTAYAHQEKLQEFDRLTGVDRYLRLPLTVAVEVKVVDQGSTVQNNAIYDGKLDALMIVPYTYSFLPIAFNGGILAHEHFHFVFQRAVLNPLGAKETQGCQTGVAPQVSAGVDEISTENARETPNASDPALREEAGKDISPEMYNAYLLRGMNEGLADFWGWAYSLDDSFVARSLPSETFVRALDAKPGRLANMVDLRETLVDLRRADKTVNDRDRVREAYRVGTQYARFLRQVVRRFVEQNGMSVTDAKVAVARSLVSSLPTISSAAFKVYRSDYLSPNFILKPLFANLENIPSEACADLEKFRALEESYRAPKGCSEITPSPAPAQTQDPAPTQTPAPKPTATPQPTAAPSEATGTA